MDLIVKLYDLKNSVQSEQISEKYCVRFFRPLTCNRQDVLQFIKQNFSLQWSSESETAFSHFPISIWLAVNTKDEIVGFAAYEATGKAFFGPTGVREDYRKMGIGKVLLFKSLFGLKEMGYQYAIIGGVSEDVFSFYNNCVGAEKIAGSEIGIYKDILK